MMMMSKEGSAMPLSLAKVAGLVTVSRATGRTARHGRNWSKCEFRRHPRLRATAVLMRACPAHVRASFVYFMAAALTTALRLPRLHLLVQRVHLFHLRPFHPP